MSKSYKKQVVAIRKYVEDAIESCRSGSYDRYTMEAEEERESAYQNVLDFIRGLEKKDE